MIHRALAMGWGVLVLAACAPNATPSKGAPAPAPALTTFGSEEAFTRYQQRMEQDWQERMRRRPIYGSYPATPKPPPMGPPVPAGEPVEAQAPGVHAAGIVKATRDHLVILRRQRLHTVRIAEGALDTVASVDAFAPGTDEYLRGPGGILISGEVVAVIGGGRGPSVQATLFRLDAAGGLAYLGTFEVRSDGGEDREPIVRMIDGKLVVFAPIGVWPGDPRGIGPYLPAVRRWEPGSTDTAWTPLVQPAGVYRPATAMRADDGTTFHALTVCDPAGGALDCRATVVYAPRIVAHHVSRTAAYAWTTQRRGYDEEGNVPDRSMLYRLPLDGGAPTAAGADGEPNDAWSFDETADGELHVLLSGGRLPVDRAPAVWSSVVLVRVPLATFGGGSDTAVAYQGFPNPGSTPFHSRFAGDWIVYGTEAGEGVYGTQEQSRAFAVRRDGAGGAVPIPIHGPLVGIDAMGEDALVTTREGGIRHRPLRLGTEAALGEPYTRPNEQAWEVEAHAVFYAPGEGDAGVLGVARSGFLFTPSVLFLRHDASGLREMGTLDATVPPGTECAMCGGYYEFARPVFLRGRTFAIVGGEVVEGTVEGGRIRELRRVRIGPPAFAPP
jgi:hypothetical protein